MKWLYVFALLIPFTAGAAPDLARDLEILKVQMRIDEMWHREEAFRAGLEWLMARGYPRPVVMSHPAFGDEWKKVTSQNAAELKKIIAKWGWPAISTFGARTDQQAYAIVDHADADLGFQELVLSALEK